MDFLPIDGDPSEAERTAKKGKEKRKRVNAAKNLYAEYRAIREAQELKKQKAKNAKRD